MAVVTLDMAFGEHAVTVDKGIGDRRDRLVLDLMADEILEKLDRGGRQRGHRKCSLNLNAEWGS
ncbi:hypothetical protein D3C72_2325230 [compost metagenome]